MLTGRRIVAAAEVAAAEVAAAEAVETAVIMVHVVVEHGVNVMVDVVAHLTVSLQEQKSIQRMDIKI